jgi:hypothetical protein
MKIINFSKISDVNKKVSQPPINNSNVGGQYSLFLGQYNNANSGFKGLVIGDFVRPTEDGVYIGKNFVITEEGIKRPLGILIDGGGDLFPLDLNRTNKVSVIDGTNDLDVINKSDVLPIDYRYNWGRPIIDGGELPNGVAVTPEPTPFPSPTPTSTVTPTPTSTVTPTPTTTPTPTPTPSVLPSFEPETIEYLTFMDIDNDGTIYYENTPQEITGSQLWSAIDTYIYTLKMGNIAGPNWTNTPTATCIVLRDNLYIGGTALRHSYNIADPTRNLTFYGGWIHNQFGIVGNGANTYGNDGLRTNSLNSLMGVYHGFVVIDGGSPAGGGMWWGGCRIPGVQELSHLRINTNQYGCPNTIILSSGVYSGAVDINYTGDFSQLRRPISGTNMFQYVNGTQVRESSISNTPQQLELDIYVGALNQGGNTVNPFLGTIQQSFIANDLTPEQHTIWYNARLALQTALNRI